MSENTVKKIREIETSMMGYTIDEVRNIHKVIIDGEIREYTNILTEVDFENYNPYDEEDYYPVGNIFPGRIEGGEKIVGHQHKIKVFVDGDIWEDSWGFHFINPSTDEIVATVYCRGERSGEYYGR